MAKDHPEHHNTTRGNTPLKIEMILAQLYVGGMEVMVSHLMRSLRERGHDVGATCILDQGPLFEQLEQEGFRMKLLPTHGWRNLLSPSDLTAWFRSQNIDVLHIHSGAWIKAAIAANRADLPRVIFTHHGLDFPEGLVLRTFNWFAARHTDQLVAVSEDLKQTMLRVGGVGKRHIDVLPNGVPTDVYAPKGPTAELRTQFDIPKDAIIVGNVARMFPVKNHVGLVEAFGLLRKKRSDVYLVLVGDGPLRPLVEETIAANDLSDSVFLTGEIGNLPSVYRAFDIFALTSLSEGTSISILEAMASGTCVVATAVGGNPKLLSDGACGVLVEPSNNDSFAAALNRVMDDDESRQRLVAAARARVTEHYSVQAMTDAYEAMYYDRPLPQARPSAANKRSTPECVG